MNEQRKSFRDYTNPTQTKRQQTVDELIAVGKMLLTHRGQMTIQELIYIENVLHKQLNKRNAKIPNNVLRGIERKFQSIQNQIQRG